MRYLWIVSMIFIVGMLAKTSAAETQLIFYCPFDGSSKAVVAEGEANPQHENGLAYQPGLFGQAVAMSEKMKLRYAEPGNLNKKRGTISLWFKPNWNSNVLDNETRHVLFQEGPAPSHRAGSSQLWLWSIGTQIRFDVADPEDRYASSSIAGWQAGEWHHVAVTWDCERGTDFYIDGQPIHGRNGGHAAKLFLRDQNITRFSWTPENFPYFEIGGNEGHRTADGLIDELRIYDAPLTSEAIALEFQRIYPVKPSALHRYYAVGKENRLCWQADCNVTEPTQGAIEWFVEDAGGQTVIPIQREKMDLAAGSYQRDFETIFSPKQAGHYFLICRWNPMKDGTPYERRLDIWAVEDRHRITDNQEMQLDLVEKVDCAGDLSKEKLVQTAPTQVVHAECGVYREAGEAKHDRFAIRIKLPEIHCPYIVEWDYPDDKPRTMELISQSVDVENDEYELQTGVFTGDEYTLSRQMKTLRCLYWPRSIDTALVFMTAEKGLPAAVSEVRIYRVRGSISSAPKPDFPPKSAEGHRHIGVYFEDPAICYDFGGDQEAMPGFETLTDRLITYMHYSGQDLLMYPAVWYGGPFYPSKSQGQVQLRPHPYNYIEYWLTRFEAEGIEFIPTVNVHSLPSLAEYQFRNDMLTTGDVAAGPWSVGADGTPNFKGWHSTRPDYNILHPDVRSNVLKMVDEMLELYGDSPAFKGICFHLTKHCLLWFGEKDAGYNDYCVEAFQRETGIHVPVDAKDPKRVAKRYEWLMKNAQEKWLDWRCAAIHRLYGEVAQRLAKKRPDLRLVLTMYEPLFHQVLADSNLLNEPDPIRKINREGGLDPALYSDLSNVVFDRTIYPADYRWLRSHRSPNDRFPEVRDLFLNPRTYDGWATGGNAWVNIHDRYWEDPVGRKGWESFWGNEHEWRVSTLNPTMPYAMESYLVPLAHADILNFTKGGFLIGTHGMGPQLTKFSRAFRSLPAKPFTTLNDVSSPLVVRTLKEDNAFYFYAINPSQNAARLTFSPHGDFDAVIDLGTVSELPRKATYSLDMAPMSFNAFRIEGRNVSIQLTQPSNQAELVSQ